MTDSLNTDLRLSNQLIAHPSFQSPVEVVRRLGAIQSQDYPAAKWAVGQRTLGGTDAAVQKAFNEGAILRTHVLRPTWHFVVPSDIRWMLSLTAPRVKAAMAYYSRKLGLDANILSLGNTVLEKALRGGQQMTRAELERVLVQAGVISFEDDPLRFLYVMMNAELDGIVCSGALRGKQHTYALLADRAPNARLLEREEALAELARRYFTSRGPASIKDFTWWSGLSGADAKAGFEMIKPHLIEEVVDGQSYWLIPPAEPVIPEPSPSAHLLPNYDEYIVSYADRRGIYDPGRVKQVDRRGNFLFNHTILIDGQVVGTWKRLFRKNTVEVTPSLFAPLSDGETQALSAEMARYAQFLGMPLIQDP